MSNSKKTTTKATVKSEKESVDLELNESQLDAVAGGVVDDCIPTFPWESDKPKNGSTIFNQ